MTSERIPEVWVGQKVVVNTVEMVQFVATLRDVRAFGFLHELEDEPGDDHPLVFAPWSSILWIRLASDDDIDAAAEEREGERGRRRELQGEDYP